MAAGRATLAIRSTASELFNSSSLWVLGWVACFSSTIFYAFTNLIFLQLDIGVGRGCLSFGYHFRCLE
jgi:hypothetical protein